MAFWDRARAYGCNYVHYLSSVSPRIVGLDARCSVRVLGSSDAATYAMRPWNTFRISIRLKL